MPVFLYVDPGTTGLIAQFAAAGFAGVVVLFRSRFRRAKHEDSEESEVVVESEQPADERS
jgi:hypothetical protein